MTKKMASLPRESTRRSVRVAEMKKQKATRKASISIKKGNFEHCSSSKQIRPPLPESRRPPKCRTMEELMTLPNPESPDGQNLAWNGHTTMNDEKRSPSPEPLPPDPLVELLLESIENQDKHSIFSEPVDPQEVPDYYEIIKEPMDFATIRKKLGKGLYKSLQQLERDVFLIFKNAMNFNPSITIYYKEARRLQELAKERFIALRIDPKSIKAKNAQGSAEQQNHYGVGTARTTNLSGLSTGTLSVGRAGSSTNVGGSSIGILSVGRVGSSMNLGGPSTGTSSVGRVDFSSRKSSKSSSGQGDIVSACGSRNGSDFASAERRSTYKPWTSIDKKDNNNILAVDFAPKELVPANDIGSGYADSLMRFVQGFGPTAKLVANKKLSGLCEVPPSQQEVAWPISTPSGLRKVSPSQQEEAWPINTPSSLREVTTNRQEVAWPISTPTFLPSEDIAISIQTPLSNDGDGNDILKGSGDSSACMDLLDITLKHYRARRLLRTITPLTAQSVVTNLGTLLPAELINWYMTPGTNQPNYKVEVTRLNSCMTAQQGFGPTGSLTPMQNVTNSKQLDKGKNIVSHASVNYGGSSAQNAMFDPILAQNEGNMYSSQVCGEQFPGLTAMVRLATQATSTSNGFPSIHSVISHGTASVDGQNAGSSNNNDNNNNNLGFSTFLQESQELDFGL